MTQNRRFRDPRAFDGLTGLVEAWTDIREEFRRHRFEGLSIDRVGKTHEEVFQEVASHMEAGGAYG
jgi:beta-hydroxylase